MKTFVAENVLCNYTAGLIVIKAETIEDAIIKCHKLKYYNYPNSSLVTEISENIRELKDDELVYVYGGG
jgi:hypothetical protein